MELGRFRVVLEKVLSEEQCFSLKNLAVNGKDLLGAGIAQGVKIGNTLDFLLEMVINGDVENKKESLLEALGLCSDGAVCDGSDKSST
jgi:tRNA nucleotidyltransferase (CCA-adding enzyme)